MNNRELLEEFIEWCKDASEDVFSIYEDTENMIERFLEEYNS